MINCCLTLLSSREEFFVLSSGRNRIRCSYLPCSWVTVTWAPRVQAPHAVTQLHGGQLQRSLVRPRVPLRIGPGKRRDESTRRHPHPCVTVRVAARSATPLGAECWLLPQRELSAGRGIAHALAGIFFCGIHGPWHHVSFLYRSPAYPEARTTARTHDQTFR